MTLMVGSAINCQSAVATGRNELRLFVRFSGRVVRVEEILNCQLSEKEWLMARARQEWMTVSPAVEWPNRMVRLTHATGNDKWRGMMKETGNSEGKRSSNQCMPLLEMIQRQCVQLGQ